VYTPIQFINNPPTSPKLVPGPRKYSEVVENGPETIIFGTSMVKGLRMKEFNESFQGEGQVSRVKFHGGKVRHIE
jgi:hypothetical protein